MSMYLRRLRWSLMVGVVSSCDSNWAADNTCKNENIVNVEFEVGVVSWEGNQLLLQATATESVVAQRYSKSSDTCDRTTLSMVEVSDRAIPFLFHLCGRGTLQTLKLVTGSNIATSEFGAKQDTMLLYRFDGTLNGQIGHLCNLGHLEGSGENRTSLDERQACVSQMIERKICEL